MLHFSSPVSAEREGGRDGDERPTCEGYSDLMAGWVIQTWLCSLHRPLGQLPVWLGLLILTGPVSAGRPTTDVLEAFMEQNDKSEPTYLT